MNIPNEILFRIYQEFTSVHDLHSCSLVNKHWHSIARDPLFYKHVNIYSDDQLVSFTKTMASMKYRHEPMGHYVKTITIYSSLSLFKKPMINLQLSFPNITALNYDNLEYINYEYEPSFGIIGIWNHLTKLPHRHVEPTLDCMKHLKHTLSTLSINFTKEDCMNLTTGNGKLSPELEYIPHLLHLKTLYLYDDSYCCNPVSISIFNSIHSFCPQINSLTLTHRFRINSELLLSPSSSSPIPALLFKHQWHNITTLCFTKIQTYHPLFFTYISCSYPNLESLTLAIDDGYMFDGRYNDFNIELPTDTLNEMNDSNYIEIYRYRQAIENMVMKLSHQLKKLHLSFRLPPTVWPTNELLNYLHLNSSKIQLNDIKWPLPIYPCRIERKDDYDCYNEYLYNGIKPIGFFNRLEKLHIALPFLGTDTLKYLLKKDISHQSPISLLSNLKELTVEDITSKYIMDEDSTPKFPLYHWLDVLPNLQSLTAIEVEVVNKESLEEKLKRTETIHSLSHYKLQKLILKQCYIRLKGGFSLLCERCPKLSYLQCTKGTYIDESSIDYMPNNIIKMASAIYPGCRIYYPFIYAPQIIFETLIFDGLTIQDFTELTDSDYECLLLAKNGKVAPQPHMLIKEDDDSDDFEFKDYGMVIYANNIIKCYFEFSWILF